MKALVKNILPGKAESIVAIKMLKGRWTGCILYLVCRELCTVEVMLVHGLDYLYRGSHRKCPQRLS